MSSTRRVSAPSIRCARRRARRSSRGGSGKRLVCPPPTATFREPGSDLRAPPDNPSNKQNRAASGGRVGATAAVYSAAILGASISRPRLPGPRRFRKIWNSSITRPEKPEPDANLRPPLHPSDSDRVPHRRGSRARRQRLQGSQGAHPPTHAPSRAYPNAVNRHRAVQRSQPFEKATARFEIPPRQCGGEASHRAASDPLARSNPATRHFAMFDATADA